jgi:Flp pilus assembly protein TadD
MKSLLAFAIALTVLIGFAAVPVNAAGWDSKPADQQDPKYLEAKKLIDAGDFTGAIPLLEQVVAADPKDADAHASLGFSQRKSGNWDAALVNYGKALALEPDHRGANSYLGEFYLDRGELEKAKERLEVLSDACFFGCDEHRALKKAIAAYEAKTKG